MTRETERKGAQLAEQHGQMQDLEAKVEELKATVEEFQGKYEDLEGRSAADAQKSQREIARLQTMLHSLKII